MKKTGCFLAALGMLASSTMPAAAASLSHYSLQDTSIMHNGVTAGLRLTVPFGGDRAKTPEPRLALGLDLYRSATPGGDPFSVQTRRASLASLDFTHDGFERLALMNQTAFTTTKDPVDGSTRLDFSGPKPSTILWAAVVIGAAVGVYLIVDSGASSSSTPSPFGG